MTLITHDGRTIDEPAPVRFDRKTRSMGTTEVGGVRFRHVEALPAPDRGHVFVGAAYGHGLHARVSLASARDVKRALRRVRPSEATTLAALATDLHQLEAAVQDAKRRYQAARLDAFNRGHVVTVKELLTAAEDTEAKA